MTAEISRPLPGAAIANRDANKAIVAPSDHALVGPWPRNLTVSDEHAAGLLTCAIDLDVAYAAGVYSASRIRELPPQFRHHGEKCLPALVFRYGVNGQAVAQVRPDTPWTTADGSTAKYLFPAGAVTPLAVHPGMRARVMDVHTPLVFVEGTKQYLAAVSALLTDDSVAAIGMSGCWGWSHDKKLTPGLLDIPLEGRVVYLLLDADRATNPRVFDAAAALAAQLTTIRGVAEVLYASLPTQGTSGLDDALALAPAADRGAVIRRILTGATEDPGERPQGMGSKYFGRAGLRVRTLAEDVRAAVSLAVGVDGYLYLYRGGVYVMGRDLIHAEFTSRLDEGYRPSHAAATIDFLTAELRDEGCVLPDAPSGCLLNVRNGMLDLTTRELLDHDPAYLSAVQLPVEWDPDATAPVYERWLRDQAGDQADDLEETASTMLDPGRAPTKAVFLFGPTRSGKSTFLRLMAAIAGRANTSAVTLQHLSSNRFAPARLQGKLLNCAADLSSHHVDDLATFKLLTGGDPVFAENKFAHPFTLRPRTTRPTRPSPAGPRTTRLLTSASRPDRARPRGPRPRHHRLRLAGPAVVGSSLISRRPGRCRCPGGRCREGQASASSSKHAPSCCGPAEHGRTDGGRRGRPGLHGLLVMAAHAAWDRTDAVACRLRADRSDEMSVRCHRDPRWLPSGSVTGPA